MIKFADRSDSGWAVVEEYEDDAVYVVVVVCRRAQ